MTSALKEKLITKNRGAFINIFISESSSMKEQWILSFVLII